MRTYVGWLNGVAMKADVLQLRVGQSGAMKNQGTHDMVGRIEFGGRANGCSAQYHPRNWNTISNGGGARMALYLDPRYLCILASSC